MSKVLLAVLVTGMAMSMPSISAAGPYMGIGVGGAKLESKLADLGLLTNSAVCSPPTCTTTVDDAAAIGEGNFDGDDLGVQVFAGYRFGPYFGVEAGYVDFGQADDVYTLPQACNARGCQDREWTTRASVDGWQLFLTGSYPIAKTVEIYGKVGVLNWDATLDAQERVRSVVPVPPANLPPPINQPVKLTDDGTDLAVGLGLNIKTDSPFSIRTEFTWYQVANTDQLWLLSLNAVYTF